MKIPGSKRLVLNDFLCCDLLQYLPAHQLQYAAMNLYSITTTVCRPMYGVSLLSDRQVGSTFFMAEPPEVLFSEYEKGKVHEVSQGGHTGRTYRCVFVQ